LEARPLYREALEQDPDAQVLLEYGYLLQCQSRNTMRRAVELFERAIERDPSADKPRYQLIAARASFFDTDELVARFRKRLAMAPSEVREHRFLATVYLYVHDYEQAGDVTASGLI